MLDDSDEEDKYSVTVDDGKQSATESKNSGGDCANTTEDVMQPDVDFVKALVTDVTDYSMNEQCCSKNGFFRNEKFLPRAKELLKGLLEEDLDPTSHIYGLLNIIDSNGASEMEALERELPILLNHFNPTFLEMLLGRGNVFHAERITEEMVTTLVTSQTKYGLDPNKQTGGYIRIFRGTLDNLRGTVSAITDQQKKEFWRGYKFLLRFLERHERVPGNTRVSSVYFGETSAQTIRTRQGQEDNPDKPDCARVQWEVGQLVGLPIHAQIAITEFRDKRSSWNVESLGASLCMAVSNYWSRMNGVNAGTITLSSRDGSGLNTANCGIPFWITKRNAVLKFVKSNYHSLVSGDVSLYDTDWVDECVKSFIDFKFDDICKFNPDVTSRSQVRAKHIMRLMGYYSWRKQVDNKLATMPEGTTREEAATAIARGLYAARVDKKLATMKPGTTKEEAASQIGRDLNAARVDKKLATMPEGTTREEAASQIGRDQAKAGIEGLERSCAEKNKSLSDHMKEMRSMVDTENRILGARYANKRKLLKSDGGALYLFTCNHCGTDHHIDHQGNKWEKAGANYARDLTCSKCNNGDKALGKKKLPRPDKKKTPNWTFQRKVAEDERERLRIQWQKDVAKYDETLKSNKNQREQQRRKDEKQQKKKKKKKK